MFPGPDRGETASSKNRGSPPPRDTILSAWDGPGTGRQGARMLRVRHELGSLRHQKVRPGKAGCRRETRRLPGGDPGTSTASGPGPGHSKPLPRNKFSPSWVRFAARRVGFASSRRGPSWVRLVARQVGFALPRPPDAGSPGIDRRMNLGRIRGDLTAVRRSCSNGPPRRVSPAPAIRARGENREDGENPSRGRRCDRPGSRVHRATAARREGRPGVRYEPRARRPARRALFRCPGHGHPGGPRAGASRPGRRAGSAGRGPPSCPARRKDWSP